MFEVYFWKVESSRLSSRHSSDRTVGKKYYTTPDDIFGYALVKNSKRSVALYYNNDLVYNVIYTIDKNGLRISPPYNETNAPTILFFGGSFTYGEGVNDNETMPYVTGILLGAKYTIYNFGVHGYGPQQMLASIEYGFVDSVVTQKPQFAIYQAIPDHLDRLSGLYPHLRHAARYTLNENGEISVQFNKYDLWDGIYRQFKKSYLFTTIKKRINRIRLRDWRDQTKLRTWRKRGKNERIGLFAAVVDKSGNLLRSKYPGIEFHVLYWDVGGSGNFNEAVIDGLREKGIKTHRLSNIIQDYRKEKYTLPHNNHPSPLAYKIIADYVAQEIVGKSGN